MDDQNLDTAGAVAAYMNPAGVEPAQAARVSMATAVDSQPDLEAELRRASARTGVPLDSAREYPADVKKQAALAEHDFNELAAKFPSTTKFLAGTENARIAHDDIDNLKQMESTIGPIVGPKPSFWASASGLMKSLPQGAEMARQGIRMQFADAFGFDQMRQDAQRKYSAASLESDTSTPAFESSTAQGVYGGLSSTVRMIPGLAGSIAARSPAPLLATIGVQTEAEAYGKYRNRGASGAEAITGGVAEGAIEVGTEMLPMGFLVKNLGKMRAGHFLTGLLAREIPSEQLATLTQDAVDTAIANPDKTWGQFAAERPGAAYQTLIATITQASVMGGVNGAASRMQGRDLEAQHAQGLGDALLQFNDLAEASKVRERDASTAAAFFQSLTGEGRESVWITPEALQDSGMAQAIADAIPGMRAEIAQALQTGTEIKLPIAELMANLAGPELAQSIIPHLADEPGGFTPTTAAEYMQSGAAQQLQQQVEQAVNRKQQDDAFTASRNMVMNQIAEQLTTAGRFSPEVNKAYATMAGNFYAVQAARLGITPEEMAARYPVQIRAEALPGGATLEQSAPQGLEISTSTAPINRSADDQFMLDFATPPGENDTSFRAIIDGKEVGYLDLAIDATGRAEVREVKVDPAYRRRGIATALHDAAKSQGIDVARSEHQTSAGSAFRDAYDTRSDRAAADSSLIKAYHGTPAKFENFEFKNEGELGDGFYFTKSQESAREWGSRKTRRRTESGEFINDPVNVMAAQIDLKNPAAFSDVRDAKREAGKDWTPQQITQILKEKGFDGVVSEEDNEIVAFDAAQIKVLPDGQLDQEKRGNISISDDLTKIPTIITLMQKADLSTALHEFGHFFLEVQNHIATQPDAPAGIAADMQTTLDWFGVPDLATWNAYDLEQKRPFHEQFARGFEAYLFEGKSPNSELSGVFARFRSWLVNVYKSLSALDVTLSKEVRGVFDRMLASADAITEAEQEANLAGMFQTKPAFMTDEDWLAYQGLSFDATQDAIRDLETRSLRDMKWFGAARARVLKQFQKDAAEKRKSVRAEVSAEVMAEPVNQAKTFFKRGTNPDGTPAAAAHKLAISALAEMYGGEGDRFAMLDWEPLGYGRYGILAETGLSPDVAAEMFGYDSGDAMVRDLLQAEDPRAKIEAQTDQRMLERYGDLTDQATIDAAVNLALVNEARTRFLATELNALNKAAGNRSVLAKAAKEYAEASIARLKVSELRPDLFTAAARRAARAAEKAFKAGDLQLASVEKQNQLVNTYAAKAAMDARAEMDKTLARFQKLAAGNNEQISKTRDLDMVQATRAILAEFGIGRRGQAASEYLKSVEKYDAAMSAVLVDRINQVTANAAPFASLTIEQARGLRDEIDSLWYLARRTRQMEVDGDLMDREEVQAQLRARLEEMGIPEVVPGEGRAITEGEVNVSRLQSLRAALRRVEAWADARDGAGTRMGPFRKFIWNTIKDPADAYRADKARFLKEYRQLLDPIAKTLTPVKIAAPELGYTFGFDKGGMGKAELLHAILHTGNEGNKRKLLLGRNWATMEQDGSVNTSRWDSFVDRMIAEGRLTKADFDFAQGVWDLLEKMKPLAQKTHREVFGRYFDEVTATPFTNRFGSYAGGYVPALADSRIVSDAKTRALADEENSTMQTSFPQTSRGFTKGRVDYNKPLLLDLRTLSQHIDKVLLFSHLEQPIREVRRVLTSTEVAYALNRIDPSAFDGLLTPWLNRAARQQVETAVSGSNGIMRIFAVARARAGMAAMFGNVSNTVQQITGFSVAALKVSPKHLISGAVDYLRSPREITAQIAAASPYMAMRMENEVQALSGIINDILINPNVYEKSQAWFSKHAYFLQSAVDNVMSPIIWHSAYNQAMETAPAGQSEEQIALYARRLADSAVRETQGSTLPEDVSRVETGNAFVRMFSQFYGYFNMIANVNATELVKISEEVGLRKGAGRGLYVLMFGVLAPAWVAQAIALAFRGGPDDEDKDGSYLDDWLAQTFGWGTLRNLTAMVPVVGQVANAAANTLNSKPYDDKISTSPAISMLESAAKGPTSAYAMLTGDEVKGKQVRDVATLVSMATGLPALALAKPLIYGTDVASGSTNPTGPVDAVRGVITGTSSAESKGR